MDDWEKYSRYFSHVCMLRLGHVIYAWTNLDNIPDNISDIFPVCVCCDYAPPACNAWAMGAYGKCQHYVSPMQWDSWWCHNYGDDDTDAEHHESITFLNLLEYATRQIILDPSNKHFIDYLAELNQSKKIVFSYQLFCPGLTGVGARDAITSKNYSPWKIN